MYENAPTELGRYLSSEKCVMLKAVDEATGTVVGFSCSGSRGFEAAEIPRLDPGHPRESNMSKPVFKDEMDANQEEKERVEEEGEEKGDSVKRLQAMTDADMKKWMETLMPPGTKCIFVARCQWRRSFRRKALAVRC